MAKVGIESFLLDCHLNDNMAEIEAKYGVKGFAVIVKLWQKIYSDKGYYCEWVERSPLLFSSQFGWNSGVDLNLINNVVSEALKIGIFDNQMYEKYSILTSERIQKQYFDVVKRRSEIVARKEYLLLSDANLKGNVNIIDKNVCKNAKNVCRNSTSKVKESKVKKSKYIYFENEELNSAFLQYLQNREEKYGPISGSQIQLLIEQLENIDVDDKERIAMIKKSTVSGWKSFYPLKKNEKKNPKISTEREYDMDSLEKKLLNNK